MLFLFPTVDVEGVHGVRPFEQMARGDIGASEEWGALALARIFAKYQLSATFFVDVYESSLYGEEPVGRLCQELTSLGQDVELHTHPSWRDDPRDFSFIRSLKRDRAFGVQDKDFLYKCSLREQKIILEWGISFLERWIGRKPIAHRAGGYGANEDTLRALSKVGISIDSSMFEHPNCRLDLNRNCFDHRHGVVEVPITGFDRILNLHFGIKVMTRRYPFWRTDIDGCSLDDLLWYVDVASGMEKGIMNLFMHSYSLLRFDHTFRWFRPDREKRSLLEVFLKKVTGNKNVKIVSMSSFYDDYVIGKGSISLNDIKDVRSVRTIDVSALDVLATRVRARIIRSIHQITG